MGDIIDCLFIGHNEMQFEKYEEMVYSMGKRSPAYRDLSLSFIRYSDQTFTAAEAFNYFRQPEKDDLSPISLGEELSPAITYLGTYLHRRGFSFDFVNSFQEGKAELARKLQTEKIRTIGIITTLYVSVFPVLEIVSFIKKYNPQAKIIIGGPFVATQFRTAADPDTLAYFFKSTGGDIYVNSSQGEATLVNVLQAIRNGDSLWGIPNTAYFDGNEWVINPVQIEDNRLAENMVDWSLFKDKINQFLSIRTSISCPFHCSFCGFPEHAGKYQTVEVAKIAEELNAIEKLGVVESLNFIDDTFNVPPERFKEILQMMIKNDYSFGWNSHYRCQFADEETVALMKESGCEGVFLGIESGNQQILQNMNKAASVEKYREGLRLLKKYGIITYASFIIGFPGETYETVRDTVEFIEETQPDFCRTQLWYCDPITPIWTQKDHFQIKGSQFEWAHRSMDAFMTCDLIEDIFVNLKNSVWIPQYNFEFGGIFSLLHRGMNLTEIKEFLLAFNQGIRERLLRRGQREISLETAERLQKMFLQEA